MLLMMVLTALSSVSAAIVPKKRPTVLKAWQMRGDYGVADTVAVDTTFINQPIKSALNDYSIGNVYNGNIVSPAISMLFFDRQKKVDFLFGNQYAPFTITPQDVRFYHGTKPYSEVGYKRGFVTYHEENDIHFLFTGNVNRKWNLGTELNYLSSIGHYSNQEGKVFNGSVFSSYDGDHYGMHMALTFNTLSNFENGGLYDPQSLEGLLKAEDMPVVMQAMSGFKHIAGFLDHHYSICVEREQKVHYRDNKTGRMADSTAIIYVPVTTFNHVLEINNSTRRYIEHSVPSSVFEHSYFNRSATRDTAYVLNIRNTLAVTINEEFNRLLHFGATAFVTNECQRFAYSAPRSFPLFDEVNNPLRPMLREPMALDTDTTYGHHWVNNTWVGGAIYKNQGKWVRFRVDGKVCLIGYKLGEFDVNGKVTGEFPLGKDTLRLVASAYVKNETPSYFLQHYRSNHYIWNNDFGKTYRFYVGGEVSYPMRYFKPAVKVEFENLTRYIYFAENGLPVQMDGNAQVLSVQASADLTTPWIDMINRVAWQTASAEIPLPQICLYSNLYYHGKWFRKAMHTQIGVDMRFFTRYYAPLLNPATGQFCVQQTTEVGNYPLLNAYANFFVPRIHLKFFVKWEHFNYYFMPKKDYYIMPGYAFNPAVLHAGLAFHFWN